MRLNKPLRVNKLLGGSKISRLLARSRALGELDGMLHDLIPLPLNQHCQVLSLRDGTLTLVADSPVWATRLRFHAPQLVNQLSNSQTVKVRTVRVRVRPAEYPAATRRPPARPSMSRKNALTLQQTAGSVQDPGLKAALMKLAKRSDPPASK